MAPMTATHVLAPTPKTISKKPPPKHVQSGKVNDMVPRHSRLTWMRGVLKAVSSTEHVDSDQKPQSRPTNGDQPLLVQDDGDEDIASTPASAAAAAPVDPTPATSAPAPDAPPVDPMPAAKASPKASPAKASPSTPDKVAPKARAFAQEQERKGEQRAAIMRVRTLMVKFRHASLDTVGQLHQELEQGFKEHEEVMGCEAERVQREIEASLVQVYQRLDEPMKVRQEVEKLATLISAVEAKVSAASVVAKPIIQATKDSAQAGGTVLDVASDTLAAVSAAQEALSEASQLTIQKMREEVEGGPGALKLSKSREFREQQQRIMACKQTLDGLAAIATKVKEKTIEDERLSILKSVMCDAVASAESSIAAASEAAAKLKGEWAEDSIESAWSMIATALDAVKNADEDVAEAWKSVVEHGWEMGQTGAAVQLKRSPEILDLQDKLNTCKGTLAILKSSTTLAKQRAEEWDRLEGIQKVIRDAVVEAEGQMADATKAGQSMGNQSPEVTAKEMLEVAMSTEKIVDAAREALQRARTIFVEQDREMGQTPEATKRRKSAEYQGYQTRLLECVARLEKLMTAVAQTRERAEGRAALERKTEQQKATFEKYDLDNDGFLNRLEIQAFAEGEYDVKFGDEQLDKLFASLAGGDAGVPLSSLQRLRALVSIEKSVIRAKEEEDKARALAEEEERERRELEIRAADLRDRIARASVCLQEVEAICVRVIKATARLTKSVSRKQFPIDIRIGVERVEAAIVESKQPLQSLERAIAAVESAVASGTEPPKSWESLLERRGRLVAAFEKAEGEVRQAQDEAIKLRSAHLQRLGGHICYAVSAAMKEQSLTGPEVFERASKADMTFEQFAGLLSSLQKWCPATSLPASLRQGIDPVDAAELFSLIADGPDDNVEGSTATDSKVLTEECFVRVFAGNVRFRVISDTLLTEALSVHSQHIRRLSAGELVAAFADLPEADAATGVRRVRCRAELDGATGWATVQSNAGTVIMEPFCCLSSPAPTP